MQQWNDNLTWEQICFVMSGANKRSYLRDTDQFLMWLLYWDIEIEREEQERDFEGGCYGS